MSAPAVPLEPGQRALRPAERRLLRRKLHDFRTNVGRPSHVFVPGAAIFGVLWLLTLGLSDAPWAVVTLFWVVVGGGITGWIWWQARGDLGPLDGTAEGLESALRHGRARTYDVRAERYVELEEFEDEGACWAFDLGKGRVLFLAGQEYYPSARFPSLDFSIVEALDERGRVADGWIEKRGPAAEPERVIPAAVKWELALPESLHVVEADLDRLEEVLPSSGPP